MFVRLKISVDLEEAEVIWWTDVAAAVVAGGVAGDGDRVAAGREGWWWWRGEPRGWSGEEGVRDHEPDVQALDRVVHGDAAGLAGAPERRRGQPVRVEG